MAVELASRQDVDFRAVRQLELRQRLEQQIQIGTVHFRDVHVVVDVLLGILVDELAPVLVIRIIHAEHTEADVRHLLGSAVECQLRIFRFNLGLDFLAGTADAFLTDFREGRVLACCLFRQLNKDEFTLSLIIGIFLDDGFAHGRRAGKEIQNKRVLIGGDVKHAFHQACRLRGIERNFFREKCLQLFFTFLVVPYFHIRPYCLTCDTLFDL